jgi:hypothetical protein
MTGGEETFGEDAPHLAETRNADAHQLFPPWSVRRLLSASSRTA